jgi:F-type H+-transporting ATPase subunit delta
MLSNFQYATTLFNLGKKLDCISLIQNQLKSISYLYNKVPAFKLVFITKRINSENKVKIIKNTLKAFEPLIVEFISILIQNNQTNNLLDVIDRFNNMVSADSNICKVEITTSEQLNDANFEYISKAIYDKLNKTPKISIKTDPSIIGGMKLRVKNKIFDNSVSYQIKQLKKTLHNM